MSYENPLIAKWKAGIPTLGGWLTVCDPSIAEYLANCGLDEVTADQQHSTIGVDDLGVLLPAIEARGALPLTRVGYNDPYLIGRSLDLGAVGVIIPMVNNAAEAAAAVRAFRYPPRGNRSAGAVRSPYFMGAGTPQELERAACIVMVETADGLRNVDAIAGTPGVDCVYVGPGDLALGLGLDWDDSKWNDAQAKLHADAVAAVLAATKKHGIAAGFHAGFGQPSAKLIEQGFLMLTAITDLGLIAVHGRAELDIARRAVSPAARAKMMGPGGAASVL
jgi:4-hydroxy-2-oxoheptanedioate aldolase